MTREEYKVQLIAYLLLNDISIPDGIKWIAIDYDTDIFGYSHKPKYGHYVNAGDNNLSNNCWDYRSEEIYIDDPHAYTLHKKLGNIALNIFPHETLISVEELFA